MSERLSVNLQDIEERVRYRLSAGQPRTKRVVWAEDGDELLLDLRTLRHALKDRWLLSQVDVVAGGTERARVQVVFFLGRDEEGGGLSAAATLHVTDDRGRLVAERWGDDLQRVIWDGVLDVIEGALNFDEAQRPGRRLELRGFGCSTDELHIEFDAEGR